MNINSKFPDGIEFDVKFNGFSVANGAFSSEMAKLFTEEFFDKNLKTMILTNAIRMLEETGDAEAKENSDQLMKYFAEANDGMKVGDEIKIPKEIEIEITI